MLWFDMEIKSAGATWLKVSQPDLFIMCMYTTMHVRVCVFFFFLTFWISFITKGVHIIAREENKFVWNEKFTFDAKYPVGKITNISLLFISWTSKISLTIFCWRIHINLSLSLPKKKKFDWGCAKSFFFFLFLQKTKQNKIK